MIVEAARLLDIFNVFSFSCARFEFKIHNIPIDRTRKPEQASSLHCFEESSNRQSTMMMDDAEHDGFPQQDETMEVNEPQEERPPPRLMITKMVSAIATITKTN